MTKTVLITGAGSGFGRGASIALAARGHHVIATTETDEQAAALRAEAPELTVEKLDITSDQFIEELTKLRDAVLDHALHEEKYEFPKLQEQLNDDESKRLTAAVHAAEAIAPTRPHAGVESPLLNFAVGPFASMLDRARDLIEHGLG